MASSIVVERGETLPQFYRRLVWRAKELDPRIIEGACSPNEITRMQTRVEQLEKEAEEKAKEARLRNDPCNIVRGKLRELWQRGHGATYEIPQLQEKARPYRRAFKIIGVPETLFEAPAAPHGIPENHPINWKAEDFEAVIAGSTPKVAALEEQAAQLRSHISTWEGLSSEQKIWKALSALAERLNG
jgi:hypothetical protein